MFGTLGGLALAGMNAMTKTNNNKKEIVNDAIQQVRENPAMVGQIAATLQNVGIKKV
jgi:hypothetical protein